MSLARKRIENINIMETQREMSADLWRKALKEMEDALRDFKNKKKNKANDNQKLDQ